MAWLAYCEVAVAVLGASATAKNYRGSIPRRARRSRRQLVPSRSCKESREPVRSGPRAIEQ